MKNNKLKKSIVEEEYWIWEKYFETINIIDKHKHKIIVIQNKYLLDKIKYLVKYYINSNYPYDIIFIDETNINLCLKNKKEPIVVFVNNDYNKKKFKKFKVYKISIPSENETMNLIKEIKNKIALKYNLKLNNDIIDILVHLAGVYYSNDDYPLNSIKLLKKVIKKITYTPQMVMPKIRIFANDLLSTLNLL